MSRWSNAYGETDAQYILGGLAVPESEASKQARAAEAARSSWKRVRDYEFRLLLDKALRGELSAAQSSFRVDDKIRTKLGLLVLPDAIKAAGFTEDDVKSSSVFTGVDPGNIQLYYSFGREEEGRRGSLAVTQTFKLVTLVESGLLPAFVVELTDTNAASAVEAEAKHDQNVVTALLRDSRKMFWRIDEDAMPFGEVREKEMSTGEAAQLIYGYINQLPADTPFRVTASILSGQTLMFIFRAGPEMNKVWTSDQSLGLLGQDESFILLERK